MQSESIFDRLARTETQSSARKKAVNREKVLASRSVASFSTRASRSSRWTTHTSPARTNTSSFFERMAYTDTYASRRMKDRNAQSAPSTPSRGSTSNLPGRTDSSFFDRMALTETFASATMKGKLTRTPKSDPPRRKTTEGFFERMAQADTFASATMKGKVEQSPKRVTPRRKTTNSFFDRMAYADTYASATMKGKVDITPPQKSPLRQRTSTKKKVSSSFFDNLARAETASSARRKDLDTGFSPNQSMPPRPSSSRSHQANRFSSSRSVQSEAPARSISRTRSVRSSPTRPSPPPRRSLSRSSQPRPSPPPRRSLSRSSPTRPKPPPRRSLSLSSPTRPNPLPRRSVSRSSSRTSVTSATRSATTTTSRQRASVSPGNSSYRSKPQPKKPVARPPPPKREVLKFESDDDMSFGDESEDSLDQIISKKTEDDDLSPKKESSTADLLNLEPDLSTDELKPSSTADLLGLETEEATENDEDRKDPPQSQLDPFDDSNMSNTSETQSQEDPLDVPAPAVSDDVEIEAEEEEEEEEATPEIEPVADTATNGHASTSDIRLKLLSSDKYNPSEGFISLDTTNLALTDALLEFQSGQLSNEDFAVLFIEALFDRDFDNNNEHWEVDPGTARELEEDEGGGGDLEGRAFVVKQQARLDYENNYSVAAAKGTVVVDLDQDQVRMENYSYYVAG